MYDTPETMQYALDKIIYAEGHYNKEYYDRFYKCTPTLGRYVYDTVSSYFTLFACSKMVKEIIDHYTSLNMPTYAEYFQNVWNEEWWHYKLLLRDIKNLDLDFYKLQQILDPTFIARKIFFNRFMGYTASGNPLLFLAPAYIYERSSTSISLDYVRRIEHRYGHGDGTNSVTSLLATHCNNEHEKMHLENSLKFMCKLTAASKDEILKEVDYLSELMWSGETQDLYPGEDMMAAIMESCKL